MLPETEGELEWLEDDSELTLGRLLDFRLDLVLLEELTSLLVSRSSLPTCSSF